MITNAIQFLIYMKNSLGKNPLQCSSQSKRFPNWKTLGIESAEDLRGNKAFYPFESPRGRPAAAVGLVTGLSPRSSAGSSLRSPDAGAQNPQNLETVSTHRGVPPKVRYINNLGKSGRCLRAWYITHIKTRREIKNGFIVFCDDRRQIKCNLNKYIHH